MNAKDNNLHVGSENCTTSYTILGKECDPPHPPLRVQELNPRKPARIDLESINVLFCGKERRLLAYNSYP